MNQESPEEPLSTSSSGSVELNLPETPAGYKRYIVISNRAPDKAVHKEITNSNVDELLNDLHQLHKELNDVAMVGNKIMVDCSDCFACFKNIRLKANVDANVTDNKVSTI